MTDTPGDQIAEEPQEVRGARGSRDTGSDEPAGGPVRRSPGTSDDQADTSVHPQESDDDVPHLPTA